MAAFMGWFSETVTGSPIFQSNKTMLYSDHESDKDIVFSIAISVDIISLRDAESRDT